MGLFKVLKHIVSPITNIFDGGGHKDTTPAVTTPTGPTDLDVLNAQWAHDAQLKADQDAANLTASQAAAAKRTTDLSSARDIATRTAASEFGAYGLDPSQYSSSVDQSLNDLISGLGDTADPYSSINGKSIADSVIQDAQNKARSNYTNQASSTFGSNYGDKLIDSHLLDSTISDILGTQQQSAQDYLDRGQKRGIYNDIGYAAGQKELSNDSSVASSALGTLGSGVIDKYRTQANSVRDNAYSAASGYNLGSNFNLDDYVGQGNDVLSRATANAGGDLRGALGGTNYFDFSDLNNAAGVGQGATNLRDDDLQFALAERRKKQAAPRGLGTQGAF